MDINTYLETLAKQLKIDPDLKSKIEISIAHLKENMWGLFQDRLSDVIVFGSYDRETFIRSDNEADVDILVIFKQKEFQPDTYLNHIRELCIKKYSRSDIYPDHPTIVIDMEHIKIEIVPSYNYSSDTVKIPAPRSKELKWISSSPTEFKNTLINKDSKNKGLIFPLIRILKYWNSLNGKPFTSFELEKFIVNKIYNCTSLKEYYFSATNVLEEIAKTEQQKKIVATLKEKNRRLSILITYNIPEYIGQELETFIPLL